MSFLFWLRVMVSINMICYRLSSFSDSSLSMVFCHISAGLKEHAIWLLDHGYIDDEVCKILVVSCSSLYQWQANQEALGNVIPLQNPLQGCPCILDAEQTNDLFSMLSDAHKMYLNEIQD